MGKKVHEKSQTIARGYTLGNAQFWYYTHDSKGSERIRVIELPKGAEGMELLDNVYAQKVSLNEICTGLGVRAGEYKCPSPRCPVWIHTNRDISRMVEKLLGEIDKLPPNTSLTRDGCWNCVCNEAFSKSLYGKDWTIESFIAMGKPSQEILIITRTEGKGE